MPPKKTRHVTKTTPNPAESDNVFNVTEPMASTSKATLVNPPKRDSASTSKEQLTLPKKRPRGRPSNAQRTNSNLRSQMNSNGSSSSSPTHKKTRKSIDDLAPLSSSPDEESSVTPSHSQDERHSNLDALDHEESAVVSEQSLTHILKSLQDRLTTVEKRHFDTHAFDDHLKQISISLQETIHQCKQSNSNFAHLQNHIDDFDERLSQMNQRQDSLEENQENVNESLNFIAESLVDNKGDEAAKQIDQITTEIDSLSSDLKSESQARKIVEATLADYEAFFDFLTAYFKLPSRGRLMVSMHGSVDFDPWVRYIRKHLSPQANELGLDSSQQDISDTNSNQQRLRDLQAENKYLKEQLASAESKNHAYLKEIQSLQGQNDALRHSADRSDKNTEHQHPQSLPQSMIDDFDSILKSLKFNPRNISSSLYALTDAKFKNIPSEKLLSRLISLACQMSFLQSLFGVRSGDLLVKLAGASDDGKHYGDGVFQSDFVIQDIDPAFSPFRFMAGVKSVKDEVQFLYHPAQQDHVNSSLPLRHLSRIARGSYNFSPDNAARFFRDVYKQFRDLCDPLRDSLAD